jgi:hypothetical protein
VGLRAHPALAPETALTGDFPVNLNPGLTIRGESGFVGRKVLSRGVLLAVVSSVALLAALLGASGAVAAKVLGAPEWQNPGNEYINGSTLVQTHSPDDRYAAPAAGVITSWGKYSSLDPKNLQHLKLKVAREVPGGNWQIVGESNFETLEAVGQKNTFPTRIPVEAGDTIGLYGPGKQIMVWKEGGYSTFGKAGEDVLSSNPTFLEPALNYIIVVYATWEPDADGDGYGDDSQDPCLNFPGTSGCSTTVPENVPPVVPPGEQKKPKNCKKGFKKVTKGKTKGKCKRIKPKGKAKAKGKK